jgi:hypothetical protein
MIDQVLAVSLPFCLSIVIQLLKPGIKIYARRAARIVFPTSMSVDTTVESLCVDLAVHVYLHLSFIFGILMSSISCVGYTILSQRPIVAGAGAAVSIFLIPWWLIHWQGMPASDLHGKKGKPMRVWTWIAIIVLWALTIYARFFPTSIP